MNKPTSNIEAVARDICSKQLSPFATGAKLAADVNRFWHCTAAQLESGQIDETGKRVVEFNFDKSLEAYRDWCQRHPLS